jgi:hypothetical protein
MSEDYNRVLQELSDLKRRIADMHQNGTVHEVKGTKVRMSLGKTKDGEDILTPWLNTANHRGGATEQRFYKKGQNLSVICPGGDITQGMIVPYAPNKTFKTPEHADGSGEGEESYQLETYRAKQTKDGHDQWLQDEDKDKPKEGGGGSGQQQKKGHTGSDKAKLKTRLNKDGGITHRVGKDSRVAAHKDGVKLRMGGDFVVVKQGQIIFSKPPILGRDPIPNDDK